MGAIVKSPGPPLSEGGTAAQTKPPLLERVGRDELREPQLLINELPPSRPAPVGDMLIKSKKVGVHGA